MKVSVKVFPIAGLCDRRQELELALEGGSMGELEALLFERLGAAPKTKAFTFLLNGRGVGKRESVVLRDGDNLWLLPQISGG